MRAFTSRTRQNKYKRTNRFSFLYIFSVGGGNGRVEILILKAYKEGHGNLCFLAEQKENALSLSRSQEGK